VYLRGSARSEAQFDSQRAQVSSHESALGLSCIQVISFSLMTRHGHYHAFISHGWNEFESVIYLCLGIPTSIFTRYCLSFNITSTHHPMSQCPASPVFISETMDIHLWYIQTILQGLSRLAVISSNVVPNERPDMPEHANLAPNCSPSVRSFHFGPSRIWCPDNQNFEATPNQGRISPLPCGS
jgi:hypothetical protein